MTQAIAGHGAVIAMELDPSGSPGVFTEIGELNGDLAWPELSRREDEATPHNDTIDSYTFGVLSRGPLQFSVNFIFDDGNHDHSTGLVNALVDNERRGFRLTGPNQTPGSGTDEWICSGNVTNFQPTHPVRVGTRTADFTVRMSGPQIIDSTVIGTAS